MQQDVIDRAVEVAGVDAQAGRGVPLGVEVDHQHPVAELGERGAQVHGGGRLAHAPLLVGDGEDPGQRHGGLVPRGSLQPPPTRCRPPRSRPVGEGCTATEPWSGCSAARGLLRPAIRKPSAVSASAAAIGSSVATIGGDDGAGPTGRSSSVGGSCESAMTASIDGDRGVSSVAVSAESPLGSVFRFRLRCTTRGPEPLEDRCRPSAEFFGVGHRPIVARRASGGQGSVEGFT